MYKLLPPLSFGNQFALQFDVIYQIFYPILNNRDWEMAEKIAHHINIKKKNTLYLNYVENN